MTDWSDLPGTFLTLSPTHRLEMVLEMWIRLQLSRPELRQYTHARAEFEWHGSGCMAVRWLLMVADDQAIKVEKAIDLGPNATMAVDGMVRPWTEHVDSEQITHGRLTFDFNRASVGLDLFDASNGTLFAHHLVKEVSH